MSQDGREHFSGWLRVGCGAFFTLILPLWVLVTGVTIQLSPSLNGLDDIGPGGQLVIDIGYVEPVGWSTWIAVGLQIGLWMALLIPFILAVIVVARAVSTTFQLRAESQRHRRDAEVQSDAVLKDVDWSTPETDDEIHSALD